MNKGKESQSMMIEMAFHMAFVAFIAVFATLGVRSPKDPILWGGSIVAAVSALSHLSTTYDAIVARHLLHPEIYLLGASVVSALIGILISTTLMRMFPR